jgi:hypothetical protein
MSFVPIMWIVWSAFVIFMAAMYLYRSNITKNEEDQIFLDDSFDHEKAEQAVIAARASRIEPVVRVAKWLVAAMTVFVIAYYIRDILVQLNIIH